jgi:hypothetical protein
LGKNGLLSPHCEKKAFWNHNVWTLSCSMSLNCNMKPKFFYWILLCANLVNSSCGWSQTHLFHKFDMVKLICFKLLITIDGSNYNTLDPWLGAFSPSSIIPLIGPKWHCLKPTILRSFYLFLQWIFRTNHETYG